MEKEAFDCGMILGGSLYRHFSLFRTHFYLRYNKCMFLK